MDGSVSTLATDLRHGRPDGPAAKRVLCGDLAASLGAAISMGLSEALSDDGSVTGRGSPLRRGAITGWRHRSRRHAPYLPIPDSESGCRAQLAYAVVVCELLTIAFVRYRFMGGKLASTIAQVIVGGGIVFAIGVGLGRIGAG